MNGPRVDPYVVQCPACCAPPYAPCLDLRSWDSTLYGRRVHEARRLLAKREAAS